VRGEFCFTGGNSPERLRKFTAQSLKCRQSLYAAQHSTLLVHNLFVNVPVLAALLQD